MSFVPRPDCQIPGLAALYDQFLPPLGRFVEVGASDGASVSNTVFLAEAGWEGLYVEPHPESAQMCRANHQHRPGITVAEVAISNHAGREDLFLCGDCSTLVWDQNAVDWGCKKDHKISVPVMTLDQLLEREEWAPYFSLLVIDVENHEVQVLEGFSINRWQPLMAIVETHEKDPVYQRQFKAGPINNYFSLAGYRKVYADHINSIFVR